MMSAAKNEMLDGREPNSREDWCKIVNFIAFNVDPKCALLAVPFICKLYDIPLDEDDIKEIVIYQVAARV
jgi:hypothetical protein